MKEKKRKAKERKEKSCGSQEEEMHVFNHGVGEGVGGWCGCTEWVRQRADDQG